MAQRQVTKIQYIKPDPDCEFCTDGWVFDSVPYGMGNVSMPSICGCVEEQADEDTDDIEIIA